MGILAIDPSKTSCGWAVLGEGAEKPIFGHWVLGSEFTSDGQVFNKLLLNLADLRKVTRFEHVYFEQKINPSNLSGHTNYATLTVLGGLETIIKTFATAKKLRTCMHVSVSSWRPAFIGRVEHNDAKARARALREAGDDRASARRDLKKLTTARCRQLGFAPRNNDEADAIGILDYACDLRGFRPPWRLDEVLRPVLMGDAL